LARASKLVAVAFTVVAIGVVASLLVALAAGSAAGAQKKANKPQTSTCAGGKQMYPGDDLVAAAKACPPRTTFYVHDGDHLPVGEPIPVEDGDVWEGVYSDTTRPQVKTLVSPQVFNVGNASGVTIRGIAISGGQGTDACKPTCGRGVHGGHNLTLENVRLYNNANQGAGGQHSGLLIRNSRLDHNGSPDFYLESSTASAAGVKSVNSFKVLNSYIHDNAWQGVWCDLECNTFEVRNSRLINNGKSGVMYEISSGPTVVEGNVIQGNGATAQELDRRPAGLIVSSSSNLDAYGNTFGGNVGAGFRAAQGNRGYTLTNILFHDNQLNDDSKIGCDRPGVSCKNNN